jgi:hypothetical protein
MLGAEVVSASIIDVLRKCSVTCHVCTEFLLIQFAVTQHSFNPLGYANLALIIPNHYPYSLFSYFVLIQPNLTLTCYHYKKPDFF